MPSSASAPPIASWPPPPWTCTSTNPGATNGSADSGDGRDAGQFVELHVHDPPVLDEDPTRRDPVVEDQPAINGRGVGRHASRGDGIASGPSTSNCTSRA